MGVVGWGWMLQLEDWLCFIVSHCTKEKRGAEARGDEKRRVE